MKKIFSLFAIFALLSCDNSHDEYLTSHDEMVTVSLNYSVGQPTRASENPLYTQLYNKILSKELIADSYSMTFTEKTTGMSFNVDGEWSTGTYLTVKSGTYRVTGASVIHDDNIGIQDKCSIKFDTEITITSTSSNIIIQAEYDCFLLIFDKRSVADAFITYVNNNASLQEKHFFELPNSYIYYGFSSHLFNPSYSTSQRLTIIYNDDTVEMQSNTLNVHNGEYYIFDDSTAPTDIIDNRQSLNFSIGKMTCGKL